ncbi:hypothetical protein [Halomonas sp. SpR8]|uniref:COG2958 family protein n=1 Tax=Halomonas sp. SpR8 TaxID=3050463 RepID=UPI0027E55751|nr:hypothetical protein [Halomonas sp. SpR8]MDQ7729505.1 hypothetical protein [Halomonas sp. SpR8]
MSQPTRVQMIIETLEACPGQKLTARELAQMFLERYPEAMAEKQQNPNYGTEEKLIAQVAAEIGGERTVKAKKTCSNVATRDKPRPRLYYWEPNPAKADAIAEAPVPEAPPVASLAPNHEEALSEQALYPLLIEFLNEELGLQCQRINEKTSKNSKGKGGNQWLHPDIVALQPLDKGWNEAVRDCVRHGNDSTVRLWSFEVKKTLQPGNVRQCFFQAVSNSSWAHFGYLVATELGNVEEEIQMLCALHGIGVLLLNTDSLFDSQILIPAREKLAVDWQSVNRIVEENRDFHHFIEQVGIYQQTGKLTKSAWNK